MLSIDFKIRSKFFDSCAYMCIEIFQQSALPNLSFCDRKKHGDLSWKFASGGELRKCDDCGKQAHKSRRIVWKLRAACIVDVRQGNVRRERHGEWYHNRVEYDRTKSKRISAHGRGAGWTQSAIESKTRDIYHAAMNRNGPNDHRGPYKKGSYKRQLFVIVPPPSFETPIETETKKGNEENAESNFYSASISYVSCCAV